MSSQYIGIETARKTLGDLVTAVQQGADIVLTRNGRPAAHLTRHPAPGTSAMKTVAEYTELLRAEYPFRYAVAFGQLEGTFAAGGDLGRDVGDDLVEQMRRLKQAMDLVEAEPADA